MPIYRFHCLYCDARRDLFYRIEARDSPTTCLRCEQFMSREIVAPAVHGDLSGYSCPRTGKWIEGRKAHEENLKLHGCRVLEPGERTEFDKRRAKENADFDKRIEGTVEELIHTMPVEKREALTIDLQNGADVEIQRRADPPPT